MAGSRESQDKERNDRNYEGENIFSEQHHSTYSPQVRFAERIALYRLLILYSPTHIDLILTAS